MRHLLTLGDNVYSTAPPFYLYDRLSFRWRILGPFICPIKGSKGKLSEDGDDIEMLCILFGNDLNLYFMLMIPMMNINDENS